MDSSIIVAAIALATAVITTWLNYRTNKKTSEASAASQITDSALELMNTMKVELKEIKGELDKLKEEYRDLTEEVEGKDRRIEELEKENQKLRVEVRSLKDRLCKLENSNGGCHEVTVEKS